MAFIVSGGVSGGVDQPGQNDVNGTRG